MTGMRTHPFLKFAGGKGSLVEQIMPHIPKKYGRYFEPFIGGGALFFALRPEHAVIADINPDLVDCYKAVRDDVEGVIAALASLFYDRDLYYQMRAAFNVVGYAAESPNMRAAIFVYLNRTGFNGLCRYNSNGKFNVPFGRYVDPVICDAENLRACSAALQGVDIRCGDFADTLADVEAGDAVYADCPYVPTSATSNFVAYAPGAKRFGPAEQVRLAALVYKLRDDGVRVLASNSDTPFARALYADTRLVDVHRRGAINCKVRRRGRVNEILAVA